MSETLNPDKPILWPNQQEPIEGVEPSSETSQDPDLFDDGDLDVEMEN